MTTTAHISTALTGERPSAIDFAKLTADAKVARQAAVAACAAATDGGSANLDATFFCLPKGVRSATVVSAFHAAGLGASACRWIGRGVMVSPPGDGQAGKRYASNEALLASLRGAGWEVLGYYQMD